VSELVEIDPAELRRLWQTRRDALREILGRVNPRGMRRPTRDPEEQAWLDARSIGGPIIEDDAVADAAAADYARKCAGTTPADRDQAPSRDGRG
jgi:hypothetical protein